MVKFSKKITLTPAEKEWILEKAKPLLKQNKMDELWHLLYSSVAVMHNSVGKRSAQHIIEFLLSVMGEDSYFRGSNTVYDQEFYGLDNLVEITIPSNILQIDAMAFGGCKGLKLVEVSPGCKELKVDVGALCPLVHSPVHLLVPKNCHLTVLGYFNENDEEIPELSWKEFLQQSDAQEYALYKQVEFY